MLVLSRKTDEQILIGEPGSQECITITIVRVQNGTVRVGLDVPQHMRVLRAELVDTPPTPRETAAE